MEINKNNYEAYFLDSIEGNLSASLQKELDLFLIQNPELQAELEDFEMIELETEFVSNDSLKAGLIREESTGLTEQDYLLISEVEGTSTAVEKEKLSAILLSNPSLKNDLIAYQKTKLLNQEQVIFPNKSALIRKEGKVIYFFRYAAAAAAILAFVWFSTGSVDEQYIPRTAQRVVVELEGDEALQFANIIVEEEKIEAQEIPEKRTPIYERLEEAPNYAQVESPKKVEPAQEKQIKEVLKEEITPVEKIPEENFADNTAEEKPSEIPVVNTEEQFANLDKPIYNKDEFVPLNKFAKKAILKDKTVSEAISEELAQMSNDKINFESVKNKKGKVEQFALNIGKLSISRKK